MAGWLTTILTTDIFIIKFYLLWFKIQSSHGLHYDWLRQVGEIHSIQSLYITFWTHKISQTSWVHEAIAGLKVAGLKQGVTSDLQIWRNQSLKTRNDYKLVEIPFFDIWANAFLVKSDRKNMFSVASPDNCFSRQHFFPYISDGVSVLDTLGIWQFVWEKMLATG